MFNWDCRATVIWAWKSVLEVYVLKLVRAMWRFSFFSRIFVFPLFTQTLSPANFQVCSIISFGNLELQGPSILPVGLSFKSSARLCYDLHSIISRGSCIALSSFCINYCNPCFCSLCLQYFRNWLQMIPPTWKKVLNRFLSSVLRYCFQSNDRFSELFVIVILQRVQKFVATAVQKYVRKLVDEVSLEGCHWMNFNFTSAKTRWSATL